MTPERCEICGTDFCPRKWGKAGALWKDDMITCYRLGYERAGAALRERDARWAKAIQSYVRHYGDIVDECDECKPLRALLEEAGK